MIDVEDAHSRHCHLRFQGLRVIKARRVRKVAGEVISLGYPVLKLIFNANRTKFLPFSRIDLKNLER